MDETFKLPWELVQDIFSFLDLASLASICLVAKYYILSLLFVNSNSHIRSWHRIGRRKELWRRFQRPVLFLRRRKSSLDIFSTETQTLDSFPDTTWSIEWVARAHLIQLTIICSYRSELRAVFHRGALYFLGYPRVSHSRPSVPLMRVNLPTAKKNRVGFKQLAQLPTCEGMKRESMGCR